VTRNTRIATTNRRRLRLTERECRPKEHIPRVSTKVDPTLWRLLLELANGEQRWPLYMYGATGTGKTCAALCLVDRVVDSIYTPADRLAEWTLHNDAYAWQHAGAVGLVVIDELGLRSRNSDLEYISVKRMADVREHRAAIWISNHKPDDIRQIYDDRIYSRICSGVWYELTGDDRRMQE